MDLLTGAILICLCLLSQAFFAGSEMGLISFNKIKLRHLVEHGDRKAVLIQRFLENPQRLFGTTLVGVNVSVIIGATVASGLVNTCIIERYHVRNESLGPIIATALMVPLTVMFGEIVPMSVFRSHSTSLVRLVVAPLSRAYWVLLPVVYAATFISRRVAGLFGGQAKQVSPFSSREELRLLLEGGTKGGVLREEGVTMLHRIFDLQETCAREVMEPLIEVVAAPIENTAEQVIAIMKKSGYSTIPLYRERVDNIVGVVNAAELIGIDDPLQQAEKLAKRPYIVPETKPVDDILLEFQNQAERFAVVVDEYGGVSGILTMEDIVEEIVGEIADEYEGGLPQRISTRRGKIVVEGKMGVREFNEEFSTDIPDEKAETIGGLLTAVTGKVPQPGEKIRQYGMEFEVVEASDRKISKVAIKPLTKRDADSR